MKLEFKGTKKKAKINKGFLLLKHEKQELKIKNKKKGQKIII